MVHVTNAQLKGGPLSIPQTAIILKNISNSWLRSFITYNLACLFDGRTHRNRADIQIQVRFFDWPAHSYKRKCGVTALSSFDKVINKPSPVGVLRPVALGMPAASSITNGSDEQTRMRGRR
ncbi:hypothetical protein BDDG_09217 [Blastomyces dermatitidis ATCC 18188]|uniref:Uncharacterized protein n=1 Tax=Ajellomyces dermatitidis (strain ATCC 18188 / CBS 674.68) TaxID=653446 RepID=F2TSQ9_AJEDA|nr:hypothetical protein BDDG_09217 [Blastomyces dermatitidis ATCC 18188]